MDDHMDTPIPEGSYIPAINPDAAVLFSADGRVFAELSHVVNSALHSLIMPQVVASMGMEDNEESRLHAAYHLGITEFLESMLEQERSLKEAFLANAGLGF